MSGARRADPQELTRYTNVVCAATQCQLLVALIMPLTIYPVKECGSSIALASHLQGQVCAQVHPASRNQAELGRHLLVVMATKLVCG